MNRLQFYNISNVNEDPELDHLYNNLSNFRMVYPVSYYIVKEQDILRPDNISYKIYGTPNYWWLLMSLNGVLDVFEDLRVGLTLVIPNVLDIFNFRKKYIIRN